jgi:hypothetical protein
MTQLSADQGRRLLQLARRAVVASVRGRPLSDAVPATEDLPARGGVFVTLTRAGRLRGCLGRVDPEGPLVQTLREIAAAVPHDDYRFAPVDPAELAELRIEVSVLTPAEPITGPDQVRPGRDGLMIQLGPHRGLLLPQVAAEHGWDAQTFLQQTCIKAGLAPDAWREPDARIERFQAQIFSEEP